MANTTETRVGKGKKTYLFIDGTNLYAGQYELFGPNKYLDFSKFIKGIENELTVRFEKIYFYASYSPQPKKPTKKEKLYLKNEAMFYWGVRKTKNVVFFKGYRSKNDDREKEVDVKLTADIVDFAHLNKYDKLFFFSQDADFAHGLLIARRLNKKVFILALENRVPYRYVYIFPTYILFFGKRKIAVSKKQKIKILRLSEMSVEEI